MTETEVRKLTLPPSSSTSSTEVETTGSVVIVGANGSGKSRIGVWLEFDSPQREFVHRVAAQKSLSMPQTASPKAIDRAEEELLYGHSEPDKSRKVNPWNYKRGYRWGQNPVVFLLNDFERLMVYLFSEHYEKSSLYLEACRNTKERLEPPDTKIDTIKRVWDDILPHRELTIGGGRINTTVKGKPDAIYNAAEMSDGERVIFYLIGQCLAAPKDGIVLIDEPELHIHRSIQTTLWNKIEAERPDCLFVYLTHDLDFAASRRNAAKVWIRSFNGSSWDWDLVPQTEQIPEQVLLSILGSRKPVIFSEGEKDSLDTFLFSHIYPECTVVPCGGCSQVAAATSSFGSLKNLHNLECYGLVDRDFRSPGDIAKLEEKQIFVLNVSEIENLFLVEEVLRLIAAEILVHEAAIKVENAKKMVLEELQSSKERVAASLVASEAAMVLSRFAKKADSLPALETTLSTLVKELNLRHLYEQRIAELEEVINGNDYAGALKLYDNKGIVHKVAPSLFEMNGSQYISYAKRLLASKKGMAMRKEMAKYLPCLPCQQTPEDDT